MIVLGFIELIGILILTLLLKAKEKVFGGNENEL